MSRRSIEVSGMHYGKVSTPTRTITVKRSAKRLLHGLRLTPIDVCLSTMLVRNESRSVPHA